MLVAFGEIFFRVIDDVIRAERLHKFKIPGAANPRYLSAEGFREVMHELWVARQVERAGYSGWQRRRSAPAHQESVDAGHRSAPGFRQTKVVKPEDLFDHGSFSDFFR